MVHSCVVRDCGSSWYPGCQVTFHVFPKDVTRRELWLAKVPLKYKFYESARICGLHFNVEDYEFNMKHLKRTAVPFYNWNFSPKTDEEPKDNECISESSTPAPKTSESCSGLDTSVSLSTSISTEILATQKQYEALVEFLEQNTDIAKGHPRTARAKLERKKKWENVAPSLNKIGGAVRDATNWAKLWADEKSALKKLCCQRALSMQASGYIYNNLSLTPIQSRLVAILGGEQSIAGIVAYPSCSEDENHSPSNMLKQENFSIVLKCCMKLVRDFDRPVTMFDDQPFRDIINLIPLSEEQKQRITADYIQDIIHYDQDLHDHIVMKAAADATPVEELYDEVPLTPVKVEKEKSSCANNSDFAVKTSEPDCPDAPSTQPTYWKYFKESKHNVTCTLCNKSISRAWSPKVKEHLVMHHPAVHFSDYDEEFSEGPPSSVGSIEEMDHVYKMERDNSFNKSRQEPPTRGRKRRNSGWERNPALARAKSLDSINDVS